MKIGKDLEDYNPINQIIIKSCRSLPIEYHFLSHLSINGLKGLHFSQNYQFRINEII